MKEYIEREAVLAEADYDGNFVLVVPAKKIRNLPAADVVERKRGRWEVYLDGKYLMCSACKASFWDENGDGGTNFCPNCGADMKGE